MKILLYIWQLPQNLLGLIFLLYFRKEKKMWEYNNRKFYVAPTMSGGISLGEYIILSPKFKYKEPIYDHEYGHTVQSRILGWLYLPTVGLCSILHSAFYNKKKSNYYDFWTEKWANKLGGIEGYKGEYHFHKQGIVPTTFDRLIEIWNKIK